MGLKQLPPEKHPTQFKILMALVKEDNSSYGISKILDKSQSNIYEQMKPLEEEGYIISISDYKYKLNRGKLFNDFIDFVLESISTEKDPEFLQLLSKKNLIKNEYINFVFDEILRIYNKHILEIDDKFSLDNLYLNMTEIYRSWTFLANKFLDDPTLILPLNEFNSLYDTLLEKDEDFKVFSNFKFACHYPSKKLYEIEKEIHKKINDFMSNKNKKIKQQFINKIKRKVSP